MPEEASEEPLVLWRAYVPRWAHLPLSGEGAACFGGRWNPQGSPAIYAALELSTAWAEYNQGFVQHPALIARLEVHGGTFVDLTDPSVLDEFGIEPGIHDCQWRAMMDEGQEPPTHALHRRLLAEGTDGVIYPSFMSPGGRCMAIWRWNEPGSARVELIDPENRLPKSQASWL